MRITIGVLFMVALLPVDAAQRRLIIDGATTEIVQYPFTVSLMYCRGSAVTNSLSCASFCSGALIAPHVVLTAGHCVFDADESAMGYDTSVVPIGKTYVLIGSSDWHQLGVSGGARLVRASRVVNKGFGRNGRYPLDDDVGLVFLSECVDPIPGVIGHIKVATVDSESAQSCTPITSIGFGRHANVPSSLFVHDGKLRVLTGDHLHPTDSCRTAYAAASLGEGGQGGSEIVDEKHLCAGGDSLASTCHGDSGGPVVASAPDGSVQVIGVTSFGGRSVCMASPDYMARTATYSAWILLQLSQHGSTCPNWYPEDSFASWPVKDPHLTSTSSRCQTGEWQCVSTGSCINQSRVCDRTKDCSDGSDEDARYCRFAYLKEPVGIVRMDAKRGRSALDEEFDSLVMAAGSDAGIRGRGSFTAGNKTQVTVKVVGMLTVVASRVRSLSLLASLPSTTPSGTCDGTVTIESAILMVSRCTNQIEAVAAQIESERREGTNSFATRPDDIVVKCRDATQCVSPDFSALYQQFMRCVKPQAAMRLGHDKLKVLHFCGVELEEFIAINSTRFEYASAFASQYADATCPPNTHTHVSNVAESSGHDAITSSVWLLATLATLIQSLTV